MNYWSMDNISSNVNSMIKKKIIDSSANSPNSNKTLIALFFFNLFTNKFYNHRIVSNAGLTL